MILNYEGIQTILKHSVIIRYSPWIRYKLPMGLYFLSKLDWYQMGQTGITSKENGSFNFLQSPTEAFKTFIGTFLRTAELFEV